MVTEKDYCDYDTCVALQELGYIGSSRYYYTQRDRKFHYDAYNKFYTVRTANAMGYVLAVHLYDAQKWLRDEKEMLLQPTYLGGANVWICEMCYKRERLGFGGYNQSYEEALLEGIKEAVKILKNNG